MQAVLLQTSCATRPPPAPPPPVQVVTGACRVVDERAPPGTAPSEGLLCEQARQLVVDELKRTGAQTVERPAPVIIRVHATARWQPRRGRVGLSLEAARGAAGEDRQARCEFDGDHRRGLTALAQRLVAELRDTGILD